VALSSNPKPKEENTRFPSGQSEFAKIKNEFLIVVILTLSSA